MNTEFDEMMVDELRDGFAGVGYERTTRSFRTPSRAPYVAGATVLAAVAATVVVVGGDGARSPALAWSPTPRTATEADEAAARRACDQPTAPSGDVSGVVNVQASAGGAVGVAGGAVSDDGAPVDTVLAAAGVIPKSGDSSSEDGAAVPGGGAVPVADGEALPAPPSELPPLVSLDLRGTGGLAVFADDQWTFSCMLLDKGDGFETGPIMAGPTAGLPPAGDLAIIAGMQSSWADGRELAMVSGTAPAGATTVELTLPDQPAASADVVDGRFSIWWFGSFDPTTGSIRALDAAGHEVAAVTPMMEK